MERWVQQLNRGETEGAWESLLLQHRGLIFSTIRHYSADYDDVMDIFVHVCESLRANDLARLRTFSDKPKNTARPSTWLVVVIRNLTFDWFRKRDGRKRMSTLVDALPRIQQLIYSYIVHESMGHRETFETILSKDEPGLTYKSFLRNLRELHTTVGDGKKGVLFRQLTGLDRNDEIHQNSRPSDEPNYDPEWLELCYGRIERLEPDVRAALLLFVAKEMPAARVAVAVGWPNAKSVYNRVYRAIKSIRKDLAAESRQVRQ